VDRDPLWAQIIASGDARDHRLGDGGLFAAIGARALGLDDDAELVVDQVVGVVLRQPAPHEMPRPPKFLEEKNQPSTYEQQNSNADMSFVSTFEAEYLR
jgi:hypothetical protein